MNIFEKLKKDIIDTVEQNKKNLNIKLNDNYKGVVVETPPKEIKYDLSCNIALVLAKKNNLNPINLAEKIKSLLKGNTNNFDRLEILKPGFINIKLSNQAIKKAILDIYNKKESYGSYKNHKKNIILNLYQLIQLALFMWGIVEVQYLEMFYLIC